MVRVPRSLLWVAWLSVAACQLAWAQAPDALPDIGQGSSGRALTQRGWEIKPSIGVDLTQTDNARLQNDGKQSDLIIRTSPGIRIQGQSARATAYIDMQVQQVDYVDTEGKDRIQRALNGMGTLEVLDNWLFLDLTGRIARQAVSAFGTPASGTDSINSNVIETTMYQASPYIQGRLFGETDYRVRLDNTWYSAKNGPMRDTTIQAVQASLTGGTGLSMLSWGLSADAQQSTYSNNAQNETDSVRGNLAYMVNPQLRLTAIGGEESNDYIDFKQKTSSITGWGFDWAPTERTKLGWTQENRYFGQGHNFTLTHRTPQTTWRLSDSRDVMIRAPQSMSFSMGTYFDMLNEQLKASIPDDVERTRYILALLQSMGIPPDSNVIGGFQSSRASINRAKEASVVWSGVRNVITFSAQSLDRTALGTGADLPDDDFNTSLTIRQKGVNLNWSHKLTPLSTLTLMGNKSKTSGDTSNLATDRTMYSLILTSKLGARTTASLGMRRTNVSGRIDYIENAILGSLLMVF
jgi:uncharacterized protein (PEP-CTERM system associated)